VSRVTPRLEPDLGDLRREIEAALERVLTARVAPEIVGAPIRYALSGAGKRLRPCLTLAVADSLASRTGLSPASARSRALPAACAVEMIHCYSLVHDDLPAMDNDDLRRGRPTTHVVYGDGLAILAGDALLTEAFAVLAESPSPALPVGGVEAPAPQRLRAIAVLASAAGAAGMVGGQAIDLAAVGRAAASVGALTLDAETLEDMHRRKTGALIRAAATTGAILTGADEDTTRAVDDYARDFGLAFQIIDDVLDVEGSDHTLGKTAGKDAAAGKPTFPALYGVEGSRRRAADRVHHAVAALDRIGLGGRLADIAAWNLTRQR
jgi:geranylgeranyl pyrophosphate synthase